MSINSGMSLPNLCPIPFDSLGDSVPFIITVCCWRFSLVVRWNSLRKRSHPPMIFFFGSGALTNELASFFLPDGRSLSFTVFQIALIPTLSPIDSRYHNLNSVPYSQEALRIEHKPYRQSNTLRLSALPQSNNRLYPVWSGYISLASSVVKI